MSWHKSYAVAFGFSQFVFTVSVLVYYNSSKRPLMTYSTHITDAQLAKAFNDSRITLVLHPGQEGMQMASAAGADSALIANPYARMTGVLATQPSNGLGSLWTTQVGYPLILAAPSMLAMLIAFAIAHGMDSGQLNPDASYGEHGIAENMLSETGFWVFVFFAHCAFVLMMASPVALGMLLLWALSVSLVMALFCTLAVNNDPDNPAQKFMALLLVIGCGIYVAGVGQSKVLHSTTCTFVAWVCNMFLNMMLLYGHHWDNPVMTRTIMNCRCTYLILCCWCHAMLYIMI